MVLLLRDQIEVEEALGSQDLILEHVLAVEQVLDPAHFGGILHDKHQGDLVKSTLLAYTDKHAENLDQLREIKELTAVPLVGIGLSK